MTIREIFKRFCESTMGGVITVVNWTAVSDGNRYVYFFCKRWTVLTDKLIGDQIPGFKSTEHWQIAAIGDAGEIVAMFPGCQVKAYVKCQNKPPAVECYELK